jgi:hypothetical protein
MHAESRGAAGQDAGGQEHVSEHDGQSRRETLRRGEEDGQPDRKGEDHGERDREQPNRDGGGGVEAPAKDGAHGSEHARVGLDETDALLRKGPSERG